MGNLNTVTMSGNLTRDPEWRDFGDDNGVCGLSIAVNSRKKEGNDWVEVPNFFDWAIFGGLGKWYFENHRKGDLVVLTGRAQQRKWQDKESGENRYGINFVATDAELSAGKGRKNGSGSSEQREPARVGGNAGSLPWEADDDEIKF
jgi:single-strand DNA-binding protein